MSAHTHTPGPWITELESTYPLQVFNADPAPGRLEICNIGGNGFCPDSDEENRANARLIAAAPQLLEALKHARQLVASRDVVLDRAALRYYDAALSAAQSS